MEDTKSLLIMVLHKVFEEQPNIIENTFQLIHNFNNGKIEKRNYEKTLKTICDLMNDKLPSPILFYILTLVDMPKNFSSCSPIIQKMQKTHDFVPEINVRPHLVEYLKNMKSSCKDPEEKMHVTASNDKSAAQSAKIKPSMKPNRTNRKSPSSKMHPSCLLDICANYIVNEEFRLKEMYKNLHKKTWYLINHKSKKVALNQCYKLLEDVNRKMIWLRELETDNISYQVLKYEYENTDIFLKSNHIFNYMKKDPSILSSECETIVRSFL